jgi:hypothetical protein
LLALLGTHPILHVSRIRVNRHNYPEDGSISERGKKLPIKSDKSQEVEFSSEMPLEAQITLPSPPPQKKY